MRAMSLSILKGKHMTPTEIEQKVFELEHVRIVIRAKSSESLGDYSYLRKAADGSSITEWIHSRLKHIVGDSDVVVVDGSGAIPHGRTRMSTLRASYIR
jgi:hypothetical protein